MNVCMLAATLDVGAGCAIKQASRRTTGIEDSQAGQTGAVRSQAPASRDASAELRPRDGMGAMYFVRSSVAPARQLTPMLAAAL